MHLTLRTGYCIPVHRLLVHVTSRRWLKASVAQQVFTQILTFVVDFLEL